MAVNRFIDRGSNERVISPALAWPLSDGREQVDERSCAWSYCSPGTMYSTSSPSLSPFR